MQSKEGRGSTHRSNFGGKKKKGKFSDETVAVSTQRPYLLLPTGGRRRSYFHPSLFVCLLAGLLKKVAYGFGQNFHE